MPTIMTPEEVRKKFGPLFCKRYVTIVDEKNGVAQILEDCIARGPIEWDIVNRKRTGGVITDIKAMGTSMTMDVEIGERELSFGPASAKYGAQGLKSLTVEGDRVKSHWVGLAGASVGIGACIPQAPDVIETIYPDDFKIGGAHRAEVEVITPKMIRVILGLDDTDTPSQGATWVVTMKMSKECPYGEFIEHKIIQLNPEAPNKTTNCCSTAISFAIKEEDKEKLIEYAKEFFTKESVSDDTVMTVYEGLRIPEELQDWSWKAKSILYTEKDAVDIAKRNGVRTYGLKKGTKGIIGAVAAIGCFDMGLRSAGLPEDFD